jgi:Putative MetA-pathway of phenol degradation
MNPDTQYQNGSTFTSTGVLRTFLRSNCGLAWWATSSSRLVTTPGQAQRSGDSGRGLAGVGPQVGFLFPIGDVNGYVNVKAYKEFAAQNHPEGWNAWLTFALSRKGTRLITEADVLQVAIPANSVAFLFGTASRCMRFATACRCRLLARPWPEAASLNADGSN